jgi:hypothetical protein
MRRLLFALLLLPTSLFAIELDDCRGALTHLSALYEIRSLMMKRYTSSYDVDRLIDRRLQQLREPLPGGGYRWVTWVRRDSDAPVDKKVHKLRGGSSSDRFESSADHVFAVRIVVPSKRSLFNANSPVTIRAVEITYITNGRAKTRTERIDATMSPDTSRTFDLGTIADHVEVAVEVASKSEAVVETHYRQAVAEDDPANPAYSTVQALSRIRYSADPHTIDTEIASLERGLFPGSDPLPILSIIGDFRRADELIRSSKTEEQEKGDKLLKETLRRLR